MAGIVNWFINGIASALSAVLSLLPSDPLSQVDWSAVAPYLGTVNYFIPVGAIVTLLGSYLVAVALWYLYRWVLRFIRFIG